MKIINFSIAVKVVLISSVILYSTGCSYQFVEETEKATENGKEIRPVTTPFKRTF